MCKLLFFSVGNGHLIIRTSACQAASSCPSCGCVGERRHSRYTRIFGDLPTSGHCVLVLMLSRKYFCANPDCTQKVFTKRLKNEISPYHRRFTWFTELLRSLALELGRNKGSAMAHLTYLPVSPSTILEDDKETRSGCTANDVRDYWYRRLGFILFGGKNTK